MLQTTEFARKYVTLDPDTKQSLKQPHRVVADIAASLRAYRKRQQGQVWASIKEGVAVLRPAWLAALITIAVVILLQLPQLVDVLVSISKDDGVFSIHHLWLFISIMIFANSAWYFPRALLYVKYRTTPPCSEQRFELIRRWIPRSFGVLPLVSLAIAYARGDQWSFAVFYLIVAASFLRFLVVRRYLLFSNPTSKIVLHEKMPRRTYKWLWLILAMVFALLCVFLVFRVTPPQVIGPLSIVLLAFSSWIAVGTILLIYPTYRYTIPSLVVMVVLLAVVFSFTNDNHHVRTIAGGPAPWQRESVTQHLGEWLDVRSVAWGARSSGKPYPVVVVAAEGGGIRAAYWTASVLAHLEDAIPGFACHVFAISGVSGGSLGGAVFAGLVADRVETDDSYVCDGRINTHTAAFLQKTQMMLGEDFLGPTLAGMLFSDVVQQIWPVSAFPDRAVYLEESWENAWRKATGTDRFSSSFRSLWGSVEDEKYYQIPSLFLNGTWVENGMRNITSNLQPISSVFVYLDDVVDMLGKPIRLSTAVHMSARFTYISPAGTVETGNQQTRRVVDGGYFENSGGMTAAEIISVIRLRCPDNKCPYPIKPVVLIISNNPDNPNKGDSAQDATSGGMWVPEALSPVVTLFNTRPARGFHAERFLQETVGESSYRFQLARGKDATIPLGWMLSGDVQKEISEQVEELPHVDTLKALIGHRGVSASGSTRNAATALNP